MPDPKPTRVIVATGFNDEYLDVVELLDVSNETSVTNLGTLAPYPYIADGTFSMFNAASNRLVICGGWNGSYNGDCFSYDEPKNTWEREVYSVSPAARKTCVAFKRAALPYDIGSINGGAGVKIPLSKKSTVSR